MTTAQNRPARPPLLRVDGELDLQSRDAVAALLAPAVAGSAPVVVLHTSGVTFIDCAGLTPIREAALQLQARRARLQLPFPAAAVVRLAHLTSSCAVLGIVDPPPRERRPAWTCPPAAVPTEPLVPRQLSSFA